jgi:hypothetical protein
VILYGFLPSRYFRIVAFILFCVDIHKPPIFIVIIQAHRRVVWGGGIMFCSLLFTPKTPILTTTAAVTKIARPRPILLLISVPP